MKSALEAVVKAITWNKTVVRLDIREGDTNLFLGLWLLLNNDLWWDWREQVITELLKSVLENNTSIKEIQLKDVYANYINQFVDIAKHSQQLETVHFNGNGITKEMASHIMMQLAIKQLIFMQCEITDDVAQVFVDWLKKGDQSFCEIKLFETKSSKWNGFWRNDHETWSDYT